MKIGVLTRNQNAWCSANLIRRLAEKGAEVLPLDFPHLTARVKARAEISYKDQDLTDLDLLLVRPIGRGSLEEIIFQLDVLHTIESEGVRVVNKPSAIEKAVDKYYALKLASDAGLLTPRTVVTQSIADAVKAFKEFGSDVVIKPVFGSRGIGAAHISDPDVAERIFRTLKFYRHVIYVQEYISHGAKDTRILVVGNRAVAGMHRVAKGWKTNVSLGATPIALEPSPQLEETALRAARAVGCDIAGVDLMTANNTIILNEVNSQPGWRGLQSTTKTDIAGEIADYLLTLAKK